MPPMTGEKAYGADRIRYGRTPENLAEQILQGLSSDQVKPLIPTLLETFNNLQGALGLLNSRAGLEGARQIERILSRFVDGVSIQSIADTNDVNGSVVDKSIKFGLVRFRNGLVGSFSQGDGEVDTVWDPLREAVLKQAPDTPLAKQISRYLETREHARERKAMVRTYETTPFAGKDTLRRILLRAGLPYGVVLGMTREQLLEISGIGERYADEILRITTVDRARRTRPEATASE